MSLGSLDDPSIEGILKNLDENCFDLENSLESFQRDRLYILNNQKAALARYESELFEIESKHAKIEDFNPRTASVDHNIFKHLNLNKANGISLDEEQKQPAYSEDVKGKMLMVMDQNSYIERNKKFTELDQIPVPTFEEKKQLRENMFFFLEDSTIEETRLEIEIDQARENGDHRLVEELTDALYVLQRLHSEKLMNFITEYQPQTGTKNWGSDPDYAKLSRQLVNLADSYAIHEDSQKKKVH